MPIRLNLMLLAAVMFCLTLTPPVLGTTIWPSRFTCPNCGRVYQDCVIMSTNTFGGWDSEFRAYALGFDPLGMLVHTCPKCGCPDRDSLGLDDHARLSRREKARILSLLLDYCRRQRLKPKDFTPSHGYEVLAEILLLRGRPERAECGGLSAGSLGGRRPQALTPGPSPAASRPPITSSGPWRSRKSRQKMFPDTSTSSAKSTGAPVTLTRR